MGVVRVVEESFNFSSSFTTVDVTLKTAWLWIAFRPSAFCIS